MFRSVVRCILHNTGQVDSAAWIYEDFISSSIQTFYAGHWFCKYKENEMFSANLTLIISQFWCNSLSLHSKPRRRGTTGNLTTENLINKVALIIAWNERWWNKVFIKGAPRELFTQNLLPTFTFPPVELYTHTWNFLAINLAIGWQRKLRRK